MKIKKGDTVKIIAGKDKGKTGSVVRALPKENRVVVEGVALVKRHRKGASGQTGRIIERPSPVHISNVMVLDPETKKPTRVRFERKGGSRVRLAVKSGKILS